MSCEKSVATLRLEIAELKKELHLKERLLKELESGIQDERKFTYNGAFSVDEVVRYSRQMLVPGINVEGQLLLKNSKVLIVGVGGLGCPAALYLAAAGVGEIVLADYDDVELSNLHRQILHTQNFVGKPKVESAQNFINQINKNVKVAALKIQMTSKNIEGIIKHNSFNVIIDGSDNVATRYLLNDVCVLYNIPLVSGSALQLDGQLTVYHYKEGPCYRCLFPDPPPVETVASCGDAGVLGAVPGVIGVLQALEAIKIIVGSLDVLSGRFLVFDGSNTTFRKVKLRNKDPNCKICGNNPTVTDLIDYEQFCGSRATDKVISINILESQEHVNVTDVDEIVQDGVIIDVRPEIEFKMCNLPHTINFPYSKIEKNHAIGELTQCLEQNASEGKKNVYLLCRRGNDSQRALKHLKEKMGHMNIRFFNIKGGLHAYSQFVDSSFPVY